MKFNDEQQLNPPPPTSIPPHPGWQHYFDQQGRCYYVQDGTGTTQWTHPVVPSFFPAQPQQQQQPQAQAQAQYYSQPLLGPQSDGPLLQQQQQQHLQPHQQQYATAVDPNLQAQPQPEGPPPAFDATALMAALSQFGGYDSYAENAVREIPDYVHRLKSFPHNNIDIPKVTKKHSLGEVLCDKSFSTMVRLAIESATYWGLIGMMLFGIIAWAIGSPTDLSIGCFALGISFYFTLIFVVDIFVCVGRKNPALTKATEFQLMNMMLSWNPSTKATVFDRIQRHQLDQPALSISYECYHWVTRTYTRTVYDQVYRGNGRYDSQPRTVTETVTEKKVTHSGSYGVPITAYVDTSPRNLLEACDNVSNVLTTVTYHESFSLLPEQAQLVEALELKVWSKHRHRDVHIDVSHSYHGLDESNQKAVDTILNHPDSQSYKMARICCFNKFAFFINLLTLGCWFPSGLVYKSLACYIPYHSSKVLYLGKPDWFSDSSWKSKGGNLDNATTTTAPTTIIIQQQPFQPPQPNSPPPQHQPQPDIVTPDAHQYTIHNTEVSNYAPVNDADFSAYQAVNDSDNVYHQYQ